MRKQLLTLSLIAFAGTAFAQTTITSADQPTLLQVFHRANDTTTAPSPGNSGLNQTFTFTGLQNQGSDSLTFTLPQWTQFSSLYPQSNSCLMVNQGDAYIYTTLNSSVLEVNGQAADPFGNGIIPISFANPETQMVYPASYGSSFGDTAGGISQFYLGYDPGIGFPIDSVRLHTYIYKASDFDATGTLTSPLGTFNVLRQNTYRKQIDTIDIYVFGLWTYEAFTIVDSTRTYSYWTNGIGYPLVELTDQDDLGAITNTWWLTANPTVTGISETNNSSAVVIYPNPANNDFTVQTETSTGSIEVLDITGRVVKTSIINSTLTRVDVSDLASGMYTYRVVGTAQQGKVQVAH